MKADPIVEQVHRTREAIAQRFGNELRAICDDARRRQASGGRKPVRLAPRPPRLMPAKAS